MAPRAIWKGHLRIADLACPVSLFTAASTSERIAFHTLNRRTGHRVNRQFIDPDTEKPVPAEDQVKGFEIGKDDYVVLEPGDLAGAIPDNDKTLGIRGFVPCEEIDDLYLDRPYYLAPSDAVAGPAFTVLRDGMRARKVAALAQAVLFRRARTVLVRPQGNGMIATLLNFDYEVRPAAEVFADLPDLEIKGEMIDLAKHIIKTKMGTFDPKAFDDRYEEAVAELVRAKIEGRPLKAPAPAPKANVVSLLDALRESAAIGSTSRKKPTDVKPSGSAKAGKGAKSAKTSAKSETPARPRKTG